MAKNTTPSIDGVIADLERRLGAGTIMTLGEPGVNNDIKVTSTGVLSLDVALSVGGFPAGRIVEIYGPESSGKTTIATHAVAEATSQGVKCLYIDAENAFDPVYAQALGADISKMYFAQPETLEQCFEIAEEFAKTGDIGLIVFDSVSAMTPRAEIEGEYGEAHVGLQARLMSQALRKLTGILNRNGTTVIFINQIRYKVGVIYGSPETTSGGNSLRFYSSVRLDVRRKETNKDSDGDAVSNRVQVKVVKNKVAPPYRVAEFNIVFGEGVDKVADLLNVGYDVGVLTKSGNWFNYLGEQLGNGLAQSCAHLKENPETLEAIRRDVLSGLAQ